MKRANTSEAKLETRMVKKSWSRNITMVHGAKFLDMQANRKAKEAVALYLGTVEKLSLKV